MGTAILHPSWEAPPECLALSRDDVHLWRASLDREPGSVQELARSLSADERTRAERHLVKAQRERFIVGRGVLRALLARYLATEPDQLRFSYGPDGKPALAGDHVAQGLRFNLSHSQGLALYALGRGREIGVDLERIRPDVAHGRIAERLFSLDERALLGRLPVAARSEAFLTCWTCKEAYVKARGEGMPALGRLEVSPSPEGSELCWVIRGDPREASRWSLRRLKPEAGYVAALAVEGHDWGARFWQWLG